MAHIVDAVKDAVAAKAAAANVTVITAAKVTTTVVKVTTTVVAVTVANIAVTTVNVAVKVAVVDLDVQSKMMTLETLKSKVLCM